MLTTDQPQSVRHIFYRMTDPRLAEPVEKSERSYRHVQYRLKELRRAGAIRMAGSPTRLADRISRRAMGIASTLSGR
jgi:hypothetical protein